MPELPDLQAFAKNLNKRLRRKVVNDVHAEVTSKMNVPVAKLKKAIVGARVDDISRDGKELLFTFSSESTISMHLMLHGALYVEEGKNDRKNTIVEIVFEDNVRLVLTDWQKAAVVTLNPEPKSAPDALSKDITADYLAEILASRATIKNILLDQKKIRGIGNAYADEILWDAGISPFSIANKIPTQYIARLGKSIKHVLAHAEKEILKSHPDIISGEVRDFLLIHNTHKQKDPDGKPIEHSTASGRKTYFTASQELFK